MEYKSYSVYDDKEFFNKYIDKRRLGQSPNELIEEPVLNKLINDVKGKHVLDLGCGDGKYGINLLEKGAEHYYGIEGSKNMAGLAREMHNSFNSTIDLADIEQIEFGSNSYDLVISRLVLHYIEDLSALFRKVLISLKEGGEFVFSIEHPIITSCYEAYHQKTKRGNWIVDNYFVSGERVNIWNEKKVIKYHRTLEEYWEIINNSGFMVLEIRESKPMEKNFSSKEEFERRNRIPLFLLFKLKKQ